MASKYPAGCGNATAPGLRLPLPHVQTVADGYRPKLGQAARHADGKIIAILAFLWQSVIAAGPMNNSVGGQFAMKRMWVRGRRARVGMLLVYAVIALVALIAIASLAVDYGRVQIAKTQLLATADAASRAAAEQLPDQTAATAKAIYIASQGTVDGSALTITASD